MPSRAADTDTEVYVPENAAPPAPAAPAGRPERAVHRSTWIVSALTFASRILGLVRDKGLVLLFGGAPWALDAFLLAFTIPNLFRRLFGEGALTAAFLPAFVKTWEKRGREEATRLGGAVLTRLALGTAFLAGAGMLLAAGALAFLPKHFENGEQIRLTLALGWRMLPFLCLICCAALLAAMLQGARRFALPAAMSILLNLSMLAAFLYLYLRPGEVGPEEGLRTVAWAVVAGGAVQILILLPALAREGIRLRPRLEGGPALTEVGRALGPTALGLGVVQLNVLLDNLIAYALSLGGAEGANTYLYLGNRLMQLPLGVFGIAIATTVFPYLSAHAAQGETEGLLRRIQTAVRMAVFIMLPAGVGLAVLADPLVRAIYQEPNLTFSHTAVYRTALVLACYAGGLVFFTLQHILTRVYYALQDYRTPVRLAMAMVGVNLVLNLLLIRAPDLYRLWTHTVVPGMNAATPLGEAGLALATSLTALLNAALLWFFLRRRWAKERVKPWWRELGGGLAVSTARIALAAAAMGYFVYLTRNSIPWEPEWPVRLEHGLVPVFAGAAAYFILCQVIPVPELQEFVLRRKRGEAKAEDGGAED